MVLCLYFSLLIIEFRVCWQIGKIVLKTEIEGIFSYSCDVREASILSEPPPCPPFSRKLILLAFNRLRSMIIGHEPYFEENEKIFLLI